MQNTTIRIPKPFKYVSELFNNELFPDFQKDLPDNVYIDKQSTGCGATTAVLTNDVDYVVAVPFITLGSNKVSQSQVNKDLYPYDLFMFSGDTSQESLESYLKDTENTIQKILVTYDSLARLSTLINTTKYKLFVDEGHKLVEYSGNFKPRVVLNILQSLHKFKSYVICTATPTKIKYLPEELKTTPRITLDWEVKSLVHFNHNRVNNNQLRASIISIALRFLRDEEEGNVYFYYNSVVSVAKTIKDLVGLFGYTDKDIKVICANTTNNIKVLKRAGKGFYPRQALELDEHGSLSSNIRKVTFVTSTAFEGQDFLDPDGKTYIISDGRLDHTKLDIATQVSQIVGRLRDSKYKNTVNMIWTESPVLGFETLEEYEVYLKDRKTTAELVVKDFNVVKMDLSKRAIIDKTATDPFYIDMSEGDNMDLIVNPGATNHLMNVYEGIDQQYYVNTHELESVNRHVGEHVEHTLKDVFVGKVTSNFIVPSLSTADKIKLGYKGSFTEVAEKYAEALKKLHPIFRSMLSEESVEFYKELKESVESDSRFDVLVEYITVFGVDELLESKGDSAKAQYYLTKKLQEHKDKERINTMFRMVFKDGDKYVREVLVEKLKDMSRTLCLEKPLKLSDLSRIFNVKKTTTSIDGVRQHAVVLTSKRPYV